MRRLDEEASRRPLLARLIWVLVGVISWAGCKGCSEEHTADEVVSLSEPEDAGAGPVSTPLPENFELGVADLSLLEHAGEMDLKNRYASAVMVSFNDAMEGPQCNGTLVAPNLVLTAGSCVCSSSKHAGSGSAKRVLVDGSACVPQVFVTTVVNRAVRDMRWKEDTPEMEFRIYRGIVRPHPQLQVVLGEREEAVSAHADLAAILLDKPIDGEIAPARLARSEARPGEALVMAGYAHDAKRGFGGVYGVRYFRKNLVTRAVTDGNGSYRQQGPYLWDGYAGGPCFREDATGQRLVGVASKGADEELTFTSAVSFRRWVEAELLNAEKRGGSFRRDKAKGEKR
jgi:hypothetical protein